MSDTRAMKLLIIGKDGQLSTELARQALDREAIAGFTQLGAHQVTGVVVVGVQVLHVVDEQRERQVKQVHAEVGGQFHFLVVVAVDAAAEVAGVGADEGPASWDNSRMQPASRSRSNDVSLWSADTRSASASAAVKRTFIVALLSSSSLARIFSNTVSN